MWKEAALALAYMKAPRTTLALRHPRIAIRLTMLRWQLRKSTAPRLAGAAAAAVALPLGWWLGRSVVNRRPRKDAGA